MELKLVVLAGAKQGLEIPLKKDKFLIGRAKECSLRAGSEAISRRHCAILRKGDGWTVRDLGSRNGTYVNDDRISEEVALKPGDELRVGPLKFKITPRGDKQTSPDAAKTSGAEERKSRKQPPVKDMADVIQRTVGKKSAGSATEDDVSRWLLGMQDDNGESSNLKETLTLRLEETQAHGRVPSTSATNGTEASAEAVETPPDDGSSEDDSKSGWSLFKRKGAGGKKQPGKLPPRPEQQSKDSREAAADILREMTRRR